MDTSPEKIKATDVTEKLLAEYEKAQGLIVVFEEVNRHDAIMAVRATKQLEVVIEGKSIPYALCIWKTPLTRDTLLRLIASPAVKYFEPDVVVFSQ